ncbi:Dre2p [Sugiyamaella lignohabitans]|uniref:Dre2p n=1 Tax=Sugiyamaella lignohabitans TaxID=796027 RepID=A0A167G0E1_9ASCO|nr:Dre2p [Sugiyamaella lignohabitans]ANB15936.1 Dre2p [Sugiyamaella lignohabitans]
MTADQTETATLLILSSDIVKNPDQVQEQINNLSTESQVFHHQLLERITTKTIELTRNFYSHIHIADATGKSVALDDNTADLLFGCARNGCRLTGQIDGSPQSSLPLLLAGFIKESDLFVKPAREPATGVPTVASISLKKKTNGASKSSLPQFKRLHPTSVASADPASSVVKLNLDLDDDDELIDENDLMSDESSLPAAIVIPAKCDPGPGRKRRKACKDCTCGLKEVEEQELEEQEKKLQEVASKNVVTLGSDDMAEIDFTVPGKAVGGCGSCALGDAFRCDGCPYLGLPPFKPGEIVSIGFGRDDL